MCFGHVEKGMLKNGRYLFILFAAQFARISWADAGIFWRYGLRYDEGLTRCKNVA